MVHGHLAPRVQPLAWARMQMIRPDERIFSSYPFCWSSGLAAPCWRASVRASRLVTIDHFQPGVVLELLESERVAMAVTPRPAIWTSA